MDLFIIRGIVGELKEAIVGGFIVKIYQMNRTDLSIRIRRPGEEKNLLLSTHPDFFRMHLTAKKYANPQNPPRFCTYLRKHITGARVSEVIQSPYERVVRIGLQKKLDAGAVRELFLVVELLGKASNVLLVEGEKILDCLHFHKVEEEGGRPALPGSAYLPPPQTDRLLLSEVTPEKIGEIIGLSPKAGWKNLPVRIAGIGSNLAREIDLLGAGNPHRLWTSFGGFRERYEKGAFEPRIITLPDGRKLLAPFPLKSLEMANEEVFSSANSAADSYYFEIALLRQMDERKRSLTKRIRLLLERLERRKENLLLDREKSSRDLELKASGDLLVANYSRLKKGMRQVDALDYGKDPPEPVLIPLEESLDPAGNVENYFRRYKKAKRGMEIISRRSDETEKEIAYLESIQFQIEEAEDAEELETIRQELEEERILPLPRKRKSGKEKQETALPVRAFRASNGLEIFCGKSNIGNDYILRKLARGNDLWFHAQGYPGSHVLLKAGPGDPGFEAIVEAASIAAFYSRGRGSARTPVDYTFAKDVHRPKGARPGFVTYLHQKTLWVIPDKEKIDKLRIK